MQVEHKGSRLPLSQVAQVTIKDPQTLIVVVNDEEVDIFIEKMLKYMASAASSSWPVCSSVADLDPFLPNS